MTRMFPTLNESEVERMGKVCRICRRPFSSYPGLPIVIKFGFEQAHLSCIQRVKRLGYELPPYCNAKKFKQ